MADPGYQHENLFDRFGRIVFGTERDVKPGRPPWDQPSSDDADRIAAENARNNRGRNGTGEVPQVPRVIDTRGPQIHGATSAPPSPNLNAPRTDIPGPPVAPSGVGAGEQPPPPRDTTSGPPPDRTYYGSEGAPPGIDTRTAPLPPAGDRAGAAGLNVGDPYPPQQTEPTEPTIVPHQDEADFLPGKRPVTPTSKGGGGGGGGGAGGARGGRKPLGDQTRTEAYDPTLDRADPRNVALVDEQYRVNPKQWERAQKGAIDPTAPGERTGEAAAKVTNQYTTALAGATKYMEDTFHQRKGDKNQPEGYAALTFKATGAPDPAVVDQVFKVIDPNNELVPKERMELATRAMHDWYVAHGDTKTADKVAAEMLQHGNKQAQGHGNAALALIKKGDRQGAIAEIQKAYDWLPDGYKADVKGNNLVIADPKGKVLNNIPLDDKMIANLGTGLATGTLYWDVVQDRAGSKQKFGPPQVQPTQAIAATAPTGAAPGAPGGAPATPGGPPPAAGPGAAPPAPAAPGVPAAAPGAPPAPQSAGAPSAAPPGAPRPPPPAAAPAPPPPATTQPPPPPPQVNRPAAPAPAAPGPASTTQAAPPPTPAVTAQPPAVPAQGGGEPEQKPAIDARVPPPLQGPVQPTTTKRPVVEGEPEKKPAAPGAPTAPSPPAEKTEAKPADSKPAKPEVTLVWDPKDPDSIPVRSDTKKPVVYRRRSVDTTPEVRAAQQEIAQADAKYRADQDWLAYKQKTGKGTTEYQRSLAQLKDDIEKTHKTAVERAKTVVAEHKAEQKQMDADEKKELAPHRYTPTELETEGAKIDAKLKGYVDQGEKHPLVQNSVLRLADTPEKRSEIRDLVMEVKAHNKTLSRDQVTDHVLTAISHLESDKAGQLQKANDGKGPQASRFVVVGPDLNGNTVIAMGGDKNKQVYLHMPPESLNKIKELKAKSWEDREGKRKQAEKTWQDRTALKDKGAELFGLKGKEGAKKVGRVIDKYVIGTKPPGEL